MRPEENERLVRVGPGTPCGELMRRYWQPALLFTELPEADGPPIRVRLLGEDLLAFRTTDGKVGLTEAFCPHRRAPLFFGRNEECGIRCAYHGWKFDVDGKCVDMPSEPADTKLKDKVSLTAYPTAELGGVIWAYMGPGEGMPAPPDYEWLRAAPTHRHVSKTFEACNFLQGLEGGLDTSHSSFVHNDKMNDPTQLRSRDRAPKIEVTHTDYGYTYSSQRKMGEEGAYVRVYQYVMPAQQMRGNVTGRSGGRNEVPKLDGHIWVPIDDEHTFVYNWACAYDREIGFDDELVEMWETGFGRGKDDLIPGTFKLKKNAGNDYLVDREAQKRGSFTGIKGVNTQDFALQEGMGPIVDRSREFLGTSDQAIVAMRRLLSEGIEAVARGERPRGAEPATHNNVRPHDAFVPAGTDWREQFAKELVARW